MKQSTGWKPLPILLKALFVILILQVIFSLFNLVKIPQFGYNPIPQISYHLLGFKIYGIFGLTAVILLDVIGKSTLLVAVWRRFTWAWKYGVAYFVFLIVNNAFLILPSKELPVLRQLLELPEQVKLNTGQGILAEVVAISVVVVIIVVIILVATARAFGLDAVLLFIIYRKRKYFE